MQISWRHVTLTVINLQIPEKGMDVLARTTLALQIGSIFHINSIVVTRLIACAKPFCYKRWVTRRRVLCTVISAWVISSILLLQVTLTMFIIHVFHTNFLRNGFHFSGPTLCLSLLSPGCPGFAWGQKIKLQIALSG